MKKYWKWILAVVLIGVAAFVWFKVKGKKGVDLTQVKSVVVKEGSIEQTVDTTGEVDPLNRVEIKPPIQGRIEKLLVDEGDRVKTGEILAWMSSIDRAAIIDAARAKGPEEVKKWEDAYKPTPIMAPLGGVIILKNVVVGQTVDMSTVLYALSDKLIVVAHVDEVDIGQVHVGMPARISLDAYPGKPINGKVFNILYEGTNVSNVITYGVKVEPVEVPPFFRSQMTASVSFIIQHKDNVLLVPSLAVKENSSGEKRVLVPGPDGQPVPQIVEAGLDNGENTEIVSGLKAGDTVLITSKRYVPQQAQASSPLIMGGRPQSSQQQGGAGGSSRQGSRGQ